MLQIVRSKINHSMIVHWLFCDHPFIHSPANSELVMCRHYLPPCIYNDRIMDCLFILVQSLVSHWSNSEIILATNCRTDWMVMSMCPPDKTAETKSHSCTHTWNLHSQPPNFFTGILPRQILYFLVLRLWAMRYSWESANLQPAHLCWCAL